MYTISLIFNKTILFGTILKFKAIFRVQKNYTNKKSFFRTLQDWIYFNTLIKKNILFNVQCAYYRMLSIIQLFSFKFQ